MFNATRKTTPTGTQVAKAILAGDVDAARRLAARHYSAAEFRAIVGACRVVNQRWGCNLTAAEFIAA
jgi:hypothetical protein